jgi:hypothetical protein
VRFLLTLIITLFFCTISLAATNPDPRLNRKSAFTKKTDIAPKIDGFPQDSIWQTIIPISDFRQFLPVYEADPSFRTEVKITYDDYAIYVLAKMYDPNPDSILRQLGLRDDDHLNADMFSIEFDTYNNQLDAYSFLITASGVQMDWRESDDTYDAVWDSEVQITRKGWIAELKIPYSALRFAGSHSQEWGMQISRTIRRYRETDQWALEMPETKNDLPYWGTLQGISNIKPPVRLSATPYILLQAEHFPNPSTEKDISTSFGGGMDLKLGMNESYTLDMSLLPDFSQVQSDNKVKNLTAFETVYEEQRPFFKEAVDLFKKGDIFYSRRIGKTPALFYNAENELNEGEYLYKNPVQQKLINTTKISGRNKNGLAIGILNAVTANTYAIAKSADGDERRILTDPLTNYNQLVVDQALKNNSDFYLTNTNVLRDGHFRDANVTATGLTLNDKSNSYRIVLSAGLSQVFLPTDENGIKQDISRGFKYGVSAAKTNGNFQWSLSRSSMDNKFDANDMGLTIYNNYNNNTGSVSYNFYKPFWLLRDMSNTISLVNQNNFTTHKPQTAKVEYNTFLTTLNYFSMWAEAGHTFTETYDYYEPRTSGMYYLKPKSTWGYIGFSSDYRNRIALDGELSGYYSARDNSKGFEVELSPIVRLNNHFTFNVSSSYEKNMNDYGFAGKEGDDVIFGNREIYVNENSFSSKYLFKNDVSLSITARHYYARGKYNSFYTLLDNGRLEPATDYNITHDFNFNSFNIDMVFSWIFAPGSSFNFVWKNEITTETDAVSGSYFNNLNDTFMEPQLNNISLKVLYYIDYQRLRKNQG